MPLSAPGIGSNLDVNGLVSQLMSAERQPLVLMQQRQASVKAQLSAYGQLQSQIALFGDAAAALGKPAALSAFTAAVADTDVAAASASTSAAAGTYSLEVTQLAKAEKLATGAFASASTVVGTGALTFTLGTYASVGNTFTPRTDKTPLSITVDSSNNTVAGVRDAINAARGGVSASIVTDSNGVRLVISSTDTGSANALKIDAPGLAAFAFDPTVAGSQAVTQLQSARDARIKIDNLDIVSASNQVSGAIDGLTLNLTRAKPGEQTTLTVARDSIGAAQAMRNFVGSYNALSALLRSDTKYDSATKTIGPLQGEVTAVSIVNQLRAVISSAVAGASGDFTTFSDIGITLQTDGSLKIDETRLTAATTSGAAKLARLFVAGASGPDTYVSRIKAFVDKTQGTGGLIASKTDGLSTTIKRLDKDQADFNTRMVGIEARMRRQFNALDANLASQNAVTAYLTSQATALTNASRQQ